MPEGLYDPAQLVLPQAVRAALPAVVRVYTRLRFQVTVYPTQLQAEEARHAPNAHVITYRQQGGVIWPFRVSADELATLRADPLLRLQAGRFEVIKHTSHLNLEQLEGTWEGETPEIGRGATGFLVGQHAGRALIATNYHLAREAIGRLGRLAGQYTFHATPTNDVRIGVSHDGHASETVLEDVQLMAHASAQDWRAGLDWALLSIPGQALAEVTPLNLSSEVNAGQSVWGAGFPVRTLRPSKITYDDANSTLRISTGHITRPEPESGVQGWRADLDGLSGSSGSPVLNERGEVVGIFRNHTHYEYPDTGPVDRRFVEYGGEAQLAPITAMLDILRRN